MLDARNFVLLELFLSAAGHKKQNCRGKSAWTYAVFAYSLNIVIHFVLGGPQRQNITAPPADADVD
jgi:hypothetical protein